MPLTDPQVGLLVEKYLRESDRYEKLTQHVQLELQAMLKENNIRGVVTSRAKHSTSLQRKLEKDRGELDYTDLQRELNPGLLDVSAARIMLYEFDQDNARVVRLLEERFVVPAGARYRKDKGLNDTRVYQARHRVVQLPDSEIAQGTNRNLAGLMCEVQVVSLVKHIWNELEHDVVYKDPEQLGPANEEQDAWLSVLWDSLQAAETAVAHLSRVTASKRDQKLPDDAELRDPDTLALVLRFLIGRPIEGEVGLLFKLLNGTETVLNRSALRAMRIDAAALDSGMEALVSAEVVDEPTTVEGVVAFLCQERGADFRDLAEGWPGPSRLRRVILRLSDVDSGAS